MSTPLCAGAGWVSVTGPVPKFLPLIVMYTSPLLRLPGPPAAQNLGLKHHTYSPAKTLMKGIRVCEAQASEVRRQGFETLPRRVTDTDVNSELE